MYYIIVGLLGVFLAGCNAETVKQCTCQEVEPCKHGYVNAIVPCADKCSKFVTVLGADYVKARRCIVNNEERIRSIMQCVEASYPNACTNGQRKMLQKRYPETLRIAAMAEINKVFEKSGVERQVKPLLAAGQKFIGCSKSCMDKATHECGRRANCQLDLPPDQELVKTAMKCARQNGMTTQTLQATCNCLANAGIRQLTPVCPKIQFM